MSPFGDDVEAHGLGEMGLHPLQDRGQPSRLWGNGLLLRNGRQPKIMAEAHQTIVAGARQAGTRRLVTMLAYGSGSTADSAPTGVRLLGATVLRADYTDLAAAEQTVTRSDLAWTVCFFGALTNDPPRGATLSTSLRRPPRYRIPRGDLAAALVQTATHDTYVRQAVVVSGPSEGKKA